MEITIDGKKIETGEAKTVLEAALENGFDIPHLCWHPALEPYGACRVCMVEVEIHSRKRLTTACTYPLEEGLKIYTNTEKVLKARQFALRLLLMLAPESEKILKLAEQYAVRPTFQSDRPTTDCIRCGLCVRVCKELMGKEAIGFINRGIERIPETPFLEENLVCLSCGACAYLCPTGKIKFIDTEVREMEVWHRKTELASCASCGKKFAPLPQLEEVKEKIDNKDLVEIFKLCPDCRKKKIAKNLKF